VGVLSLLAMVIVSGIVQGVALVVTGAFKPGQESFDEMDALRQMLELPWGPTALILPGQLAMLGIPLLAALFSPERLAPRLRLGPSALPWRVLPLLLAGTVFSAGIGGLASQYIFDDPGPSLRLIADMSQKASGLGLVGVALMICLLPPLAEETLFRGYLQGRLLRRWPAAAAIAVSSVFFVAAHFDPVHMLAVTPLGIWFGVVAWRCGSIWPSMLCHAAQNTTALVLMRTGDPFSKVVSPGEWIAIGVAGVLTVGAVLVMRKYPVPPAAPVESGS
jgi:membrane protease YdiL (CAAX protease family)